MYSLVLSKLLKIPEVGKWGGTQALPRPGPGHSGVSYPGTSHVGCERPRTKKCGEVLETRGEEKPGVLAAVQLPPPPPLSSPGSSGKLFIKTPPALSFICSE